MKKGLHTDKLTENNLAAATPAKTNVSGSEKKLKFLAGSALELTKLRTEEDIFRYLSDTIYKIQGKQGVVVVTDIDKSLSKWKIRAINGLSEFTQKLAGLIGIQPEKLSGNVNEKNLIQLPPCKLFSMGSDISRLSHGKLSPKTGKQIAKLLNIKNIFTISFTKNKLQFGNISIITRSEKQEVDKGLIETFITQVSLFLENKLLDEALSESQGRYRLLIENAGVGIGYFNLQGKVLFFNEIAANSLGGKQEDFIGKNMIDLFGEGAGKKYVDRIKKTTKYRNERQFEDEVELLGEIKWFISTYSVIEDASGQISGVQIISQDITKRKQAEKARIKSEHRLQNIINHSSDLFYIHDTDHTITYISPQSKDLFGFSPDELKVKWTNLVTDHPINKTGLEITNRAINTGEKQPSYPLQLKHKSGHYKWVEVHESPMKNEKGDVVAIVGGLRDITEQKKAHDKLVESEQKYRLLFEKSSDANLIMNKMNFVNANGSSAMAFGVESPSELIGTTPLDWSPEIQPDGRKSYEKAKQIIKSAYRDGYVRFEWQHLDKEGNKKWFDISLTRIKEKGEDLLHVVLRDINESKTSQEELSRINRILRETGRIAKVGGWELDVESGEGTWTEEVARIHDLDPQAPINLEIGLKYYTGESKAILYKALDRLIKEGKPYDLELTLNTAGGNKKWVRTIGHPVYRNKKVYKVVGSFQDITEIKEANLKIENYRDHLEELVKKRTRELEKSNKQLERMNNLFVGREFRIKELRMQIEKLRSKLDNNA